VVVRRLSGVRGLPGCGQGVCDCTGVVRGLSGECQGDAYLTRTAVHVVFECVSLYPDC